MSKPAPANANEYIEKELDGLATELETTLDGDVLAFSGDLVHGADDLIRSAVESITPWRPKLYVVVETTGGFIEVVERIVRTLRKHYQVVDFIVPNFSMSAGTVLVMSGDDIHMDYYSVLGPIDPQVEQSDGTLIPAMGYLIQYDRLLKKSSEGTLTTAELTFLVEKFDPAVLYNYEQARELSIELLKGWLVQYKFKGWTKTQTRQLDVTPQMKLDRANEIANKLSAAHKWHSHGRGLSMDVLRTDVNISISDFETNAELSKKIKCYHNLLVDYMLRVGNRGYVHVRGKYMRI